MFCSVQSIMHSAAAAMYYNARTRHSMQQCRPRGPSAATASIAHTAIHQSSSLTLNQRSPLLRSRQPGALSAGTRVAEQEKPCCSAHLVLAIAAKRQLCCALQCTCMLQLQRSTRLTRCNDTVLRTFCCFWLHCSQAFACWRARQAAAALPVCSTELRGASWQRRRSRLRQRVLAGVEFVPEPGLVIDGRRGGAERCTECFLMNCVPMNCFPMN